MMRKIFFSFVLGLGLVFSLKAQFLSESLFPVFSGLNGKLGFINRKGNLKIPFSLPIQANRPYRLLEAHKFSDGAVAIRSAVDAGQDFAGEKIYSTKFGYANSKGEIFVEPKFDCARPFSEGLAFVADSEETGFYIDTSGKKAFDMPDNISPKPRFDGPMQMEYYVCDAFENDFSEGLAVVRSSSAKYGYMDANGKVTIAPQFDDARQFFNGLAAVSRDEKWGFVDKTGVVKISMSFERAGRFSEGLAAVKTTDGKLSFINTLGKRVITTKFRYAGHNGEFTPWERWGKGPKGRFSDPSPDRSIEPGDDGEETYYSDANQGNYQMPHFSEGLYPVTLDGEKWGFINRLGRLVIPLRFDSVGNFSEGLAKVRRNRSYFYINHAGKQQFLRTFRFASDFSNGLAMVYYSWDAHYSESPIQSEECANDGGSRDRILYGYINKRGRSVYTGNYQIAECYESWGDGGPTIFALPDLARLEVKSRPNEAKIFLIPFTVWDFNENIINEPGSLESYRQPTDTDSNFQVFEQVYMVVLEKKSRKLYRKINVLKERKNLVEIDFDNE